MSFIARWDSKRPCPECGVRILAGERVEYVDDVMQHVSCTPPEPRPVCGECFMEKAINGACGCES